MISVAVLPDGSQEEFQNGISPRMLKALIGHGHAEFAGTKQQDAQEFLIWLLSRIHRTGKPTGTVAERLVLQESEHTSSPAIGNAEETIMKDVGDSAEKTGLGWGGIVDPTNVFRFVVQQRIQCLGCGGVKYRVDQVDNINISVPDRLKTCLPRTPPPPIPNAHNS
jgi:ubiquitin carboxyl-terminal hydrolase 5/13